MPFPSLPTAIFALAELAPSILKWLKPSNHKEKTSSSNPYEVATKIADIARKVSGQKDSKRAIEVFKKDPPAPPPVSKKCG